MEPAILYVDKLTLEYRTAKKITLAIYRVGFELFKGERLVIVGKSGCGKSTLLNAVGGFATPQYHLYIREGRLLLHGRPVSKPGPDRIMVFQQPALLPWKTTFENVIFPLVNAARLTKKAAGDRASIYLHKVGLADQLDKYPHQLSGGQRQRVSIARAFAMQAEILLMDEPFGALDALTKAEMQDGLLELCEQTKATVVFITHDILEAIKVGHRILVLSSHPGQVIAELNGLPAQAGPEPRQALQQRIETLLNH
ncbi:MAG: ABC transporter ATP-binding protein [Candidatus Competibacteraceae bacterium]